MDKLSSIFEQKNFVDDRGIIKEFKHTVDSEEIKLTTDILHHTGTDPTDKRRIEDEQEAWQTVNAMFEDRGNELMGKITKQQEKIAEQDSAIDLLKKELDNLKRRLGGGQ